MKTMLAFTAVTLVSAIYAVPASAGCADPRTAQAEAAHFIDAVYRPGEYGGARAFLAHDDQEERAAIVGLWTFEWRAKADPALPNNNPPPISDGALLDFGLIQWHPDGTEITNSGGRTPAVGDVCMGTWKQVGPSTFKLTHVALGYGPPPGPVTGYQGVALLEMTVIVNSRHSYHGNFVVTQYMSKFNPAVPGSEFDTSTIEFTLSGLVKATRVEVN